MAKMYKEEDLTTLTKMFEIKKGDWVRFKDTGFYVKDVIVGETTNPIEKTLLFFLEDKEKVMKVKYVRVVTTLHTPVVTSNTFTCTVERR